MKLTKLLKLASVPTALSVGLLPLTACNKSKSWHEIHSCTLISGDPVWEVVDRDHIKSGKKHPIDMQIWSYLNGGVTFKLIFILDNLPMDDNIEITFEDSAKEGTKSLNAVFEILRKEQSKLNGHHTLEVTMKVKGEHSDTPPTKFWTSYKQICINQKGNHGFMELQDMEFEYAVWGL